MNLTTFIRLILKHYGKLVLSGFIISIVVFLLTMGEKKLYTSDTLINTGLVSGYSLESQKDNKTDYAYTNNEIQNLINIATSHETLEELSIKLINKIIRHKTDTLISSKNYTSFITDINEDLVNSIKTTVSDSAAQDLIRAELYNNENSDIYKLVNSKNELVGIEHLENIKVEREGNSDMIRISYQTIDPGVCQETLTELTRLFVVKHKKLKSNQSNNVLDFFKESTDNAARILANSENELLEFQEQNKIINYYEQTRFISGKKEDLDEQYYEERMNSESANNSMKKIQEELSKYILIPKLYTNIDSIRAKLNSNNKDIIAKQLDGSDKHENEIISLSNQNTILKDKLKEAAIKTVQSSYTSEGVEAKELINRWVEQLIKKEEANARISIMKKRKVDFDEIYARFAPLGSKLKHIERTIDVNEKEYLENLHSYNEANLHKYNMMMTSNLTIVDKPYYPAKPEKSKRNLLIIIGFIAGLILSLSILIALELLDQTLRNPNRAEEIVGLELAGAIPNTESSENKLNILKIVKKSMSQIIQFIEIEAIHKEKLNISICSTRKNEGKSYIRNLIESTLQTELNIRYYESDALLDERFDINKIKESDIIFLIAKANRIWNTADVKALNRLKKVGNNNIYLVLNGIEQDELEELIGEVPKTRSKFRKWVKRVTNQEFHTEGLKLDEV
jgi:succinoglycan biosynthesis transport protein ExoP